MQAPITLPCQITESSILICKSILSPYKTTWETIDKRMKSIHSHQQTMAKEHGELSWPAALYKHLHGVSLEICLAIDSTDRFSRHFLYRWYIAKLLHGA